MINSSDADICGWDDDGCSFTIKDPQRFEKQIIPTFFKHSKFSSFVRQLNFYSFKKVKYNESLRIDLEEEKKTANYWKFRHEHFLLGRPDLLVHIKRSSGSKQKSSTAQAKPVPSPDSAEVQSLKKRIDEMSKTMEELTSMVQKVSLQHHPAADDMEAGSKRKKVDEALLTAPDVIMSNELLAEDVAALPVPSNNNSLSRQSSSELSDNDFVEQLFSAFATDNNSEDTSLEALPPQNHNAPDPQLMARLSDALELLPKTIQELIVNRLIDSITSGLLVENESQANTVPPSLAAATLAALFPTKSIPVIPVHA